MAFGDVVKIDEEKLKIGDREVLVILKTFETGQQRVSVQYLDKNRSYLCDMNNQMRKRIIELEEKIKIAEIVKEKSEVHT